MPFVHSVYVQHPLTYIGMIQDLHYSNFSKELKMKETK